ncbi:NAD-dependent epimerase/dehydratase family protein [Acuticoccus sp.]|uniref:NAD-dependent epimerase/dehydratase family protein n=1 Tax=Acuticoccus sp. TaxID=1904378 RepID=UPI003B51688E
MSARPILLTGSAGFVGRTIAPMLREAFPGRALVEVVRSPPAPAGGAAVDLTGRAATDRLVRDAAPGIVVHLAAYSSVGLARRDPDAVWRDNVDASLWVARAVAQHVPDALVLATSTAEVYGRALVGGAVDEATVPRPNGPYACSKLASEHAFVATLPASVKLILARPFNHTGPGQSENFAIPSFAAQLARMEAGLVPPRLKVGNLKAARDFLHVADVAATYVRLLAMADRLPQRTLLNVARGVATPIEAMLDVLLRLATVDVAVEVDPARLRPNEIPVATTRTERISRLMDWPPRRCLVDILRDVLDDKRAEVRAAG